MQISLQAKPLDEETKAKMQRFRCPACNKHSVLWLLPTTEIKDLPIKCKRCSQETIIDIKFVSES